MTIAVPNPITWVDETYYTATDFNTQVRDPIAFLMRPPLFFGKHIVSVTLPNATWVALPLTDEPNNSEGTSMHSTSTNPSRVTATHAGWWEFYGGVSFTHASLGNVARRSAALRVNGTTFVRGRTDNEGPADATTSWVRHAHRWTVYLNIGDYIELMAYQESGVSQSTYTINDEVQPFLMGKWRSKGS